jgi:O-antigen/teichoic acid export membrane protein
MALKVKGIVNMKKTEVMNFIKIFGATGISYVFSIMRSFLIPKFLTPSLFGQWNSLMILFNYLNYSHLGLIYSMEREIPYRRGKGDIAEIEDIRTMTVIGVLLQSTIISILLIVGYLLLGNGTTFNFYGITALSITNLLYQFYAIYQCFSKIHEDFGAVSVSKVMLPLFNLLFMLPLIYYYDEYGLVASVLLAHAFALFFVIFYYKKYSITLRLKKDYFRQYLFLLKQGIPLLFIQILNTVSFTVDRIFILFFMTHLELGLYSLAFTVIFMALIVPNNITIMIYPKMLKLYGETESITDKLKFLFLKSYRISNWLLAIVLVCLGLFYRLLISNFLTDYSESLELFPFLALGMYFMGLAGLVGSYMIVINQKKKIYFYQLLSIVIAIFLNGFVVIFDFGLVGIAVATGIAQGIYILNMLAYSLKGLVGTKGMWKLIVLHTIVPVILVFGISFQLI